MRLFFTFFVLIFIAGCQTDIPKSDYFPLHKGVEWHYKVFEDLTDRTNTRYFSMTNLGVVDLGGEYDDIPVSARRSSDGTLYYILQDETGSYRIAKQTVVEFSPRFDPTPIKILPNLMDVNIGSSWVAETQAYALHGVRPSLPDPSKKPFHLTYEVVEVEGHVEVPGGRFKNCIKVEAQGIVSLYADPRLGYQDVVVTQTEWYAPGVGLVKLVRNEPMNLEMYKGGTITFELERFER